MRGVLHPVSPPHLPFIGGRWVFASSCFSSIMFGLKSLILNGREKRVCPDNLFPFFPLSCMVCVLYLNPTNNNMTSTFTKHGGGRKWSHILSLWILAHLPFLAKYIQTPSHMWQMYFHAMIFTLFDMRGGKANDWFLWLLSWDLFYYCDSKL